jgi:hypothetical protein
VINHVIGIALVDLETIGIFSVQGSDAAPE